MSQAKKILKLSDPIEMEKILEAVKANLEEGWSIHKSRGMLGITLALHNKLLKNPVYNETMSRYRKCYKNKSLYRQVNQDEPFQSENSQ